MGTKEGIACIEKVEMFIFGIHNHLQREGRKGQNRGSRQVIWYGEFEKKSVTT